MGLLEILAKHSISDRSQRFRDRRAHYATGAFTCLRDQYWELTGVEQTNRPDFLGKMKMLVGTAVETQLVKELFSDLHWYGIHLLGTQVPVGGSNPNWDGYLDALLAIKQDDGKFKKYVIDFKTKSGYGADLLANSFEPSKEYLAQIGLYLKDMYEKEGCNEGSLIYVLLSDKNFGRILSIDCRYDPETQEVVAYRGQCTNGEERSLDFRLSLQAVLQRFRDVDAAVAAKKEPKPNYQYKYPVTKELVAAQSDGMLAKMLDGLKVLGDWNCIYSRYFKKQLETDKVERGYSEAEIGIIREEYRRRKPKSKK